ncbi:MAG: hypothetical protein JXN60_07830, partial [Lentisphaerae bacterium]|nr:hypothetical protein [Lentisphaerota bacterium]
MSEVETKLKELARQLFADSRIDQLLAYETGTLNGRARPCVITMVDDVERLVWNNTCSNNLAVYLPGIFARQPIKPGKPAPEPPKVGIVVKGCDSLSISLLVKEHQVPRDKLVVIGMPCSGIVSKDSAKIMQSCLECRTPVAKDADFQIEGERREISAHPFSSTESFESMAPDERWAYFTEQMNKCIRCYACRQACPNCYCPECFAEQTNPKWIGVSSDLSDTMLYHIGRMFHQAGR